MGWYVRWKYIGYYLKIIRLLNDVLWWNSNDKINVRNREWTINSKQWLCHPQGERKGEF